MKLLWWIIGLLLLVTVEVWRQWPRPQPIATMCDVGQGDGVVITQGFSQMLIDVGAAGTGILSCLSHSMPFWDRHIEAVVITHIDNDHVGALEELLTSYEVDLIITNEQSVEALVRQVGDRSLVRATWVGQVWQWGTVRAQVMWPEYHMAASEDNETSLVVRLELLGAYSLWMAADVNESVEATLLRLDRIVPTTILKVAHHGSAEASSRPFLSVLRPHQAWISVGKDNRYGHPAKETLDRLTEQGIWIRRTDIEGRIRN